ncbi:MAG: HEAT repeat domain-containing protein [Planctomycetota bacterium]
MTIASIRTITLTALLLACVSGCQDGPLYALKHANPYFAMREWKQDRNLGVTDHERRNQLLSLSRKIGNMEQNDQQFWGTHLGRIVNNDPSPEMRRLAVLAASRTQTDNALAVIKKGLDDENIKVQMEACHALGVRKEPEAAQLLAGKIGSTGDQDVKHAAISAIGNHPGEIPMGSLKIVLRDQDPATLNLAMNSLRDVMGEDYGSDPKQWIAAIESAAPGATPTLPAPDGSSSPIRFASGEAKTQIQ